MASIVTPPESLGADQPQLLFEGQRLSQPEFDRLYEQVPPKQRFELIDGVVCKAAAESHRHNRLAYYLGGVFYLYENATPGVSGVPGTTTILDDSNQSEPDLQLRICAEFGGSSSVTPKSRILGPPELVVEISYSSLQKDLKKKLPIYQRVGVREYWVINVEAAEIRWFVWPNGERQIDADEILRCDSFPGLWIDVRALFEERSDGLNSTLKRGLNSPEHAEFIAELIAANGRSKE